MNASLTLAQKISVAVVDVALQDLLAQAPLVSPEARAKTGEAMTQRWALLPAHLRWPMKGLLAAFNATCFWVTGKSFLRQSTTQQLIHWRRWKVSRVALCRDFVRFQEKMILFVHFSTNPTAF